MGRLSLLRLVSSWSGEHHGQIDWTRATLGNSFLYVLAIITGPFQGVFLLLGQYHSGTTILEYHVS